MDRKSKRRVPRATRALFGGALVLAAVGAAGCGGGRYRAGTYESPVTRWTIQEPRDGWEASRARGANAAFRNERLGATLYVDDSCEKGEDVPLRVLANHLFFGFTDVVVEEEAELEVDRRAAYRRVVRARLDGVPTRVAATVVKKGGCVFDLVLIAPADGFPDAVAAYDRAVDSFRVER